MYLPQPIALTLGVLTLLSLIARSDEPMFGQERLKVGDQVEVKDDFDNEIYRGVIKRILPANFGYLVEYVDGDGDKSTSSFEPNEIRRFVDPNPQLRTWKAKTGGYKVEAKYLSSDGTSVKLAQADGKQIDVAIDKLSSADQKYIREFSKRAEAAANAPKSIAEFPAEEIDFETTTKLPFRPSGEAFSPDALVPVRVANKISIKEPNGSYLQELFPTRDLNNGLFVFKARNRSADGNLPLQLDVIDFRSNEKVGSFAFPADGCKICGLSPNSSRLVSKSNAKPLSGGKSRIDIWKISGDKLVHEKGLWIQQPALDGAQPRSDPLFSSMFMSERSSFGEIQFINSKTLLVMTSPGFFLVDVESGKAIVAHDDSWTAYAFSPNKKVFAFYDNFKKHITVFDGESLQVVQTIDAPWYTDKLVFSDDGTRLATRGTNNDSTVLLGFDIASGATIFEMLVPVTKGKLTWSGENYLLIGSSSYQTVIDVLSAGPLLRYKNRNYGTAKIIAFGDQVFGLVNNRNGTSAAIESIPDPKDLGADFNFDELYYQFKGNQVSIDISQLEVDLISSGRIKARLEKHVTDLGGKVVDNADLKIVARVKEGNRRSEEFSQGSGGNSKSVSIEYTPYLNEITITMKEEVIWKAQVTTGGVSSSGTALSLQLQANASSKPSPKFFLETKLPIRVPRSDVWKKAIPTISR